MGPAAADNHNDANRVRARVRPAAPRPSSGPRRPVVAAPSLWPLVFAITGITAVFLSQSYAHDRLRGLSKRLPRRVVDFARAVRHAWKDIAGNGAKPANPLWAWAREDEAELMLSVDRWGERVGHPAAMTLFQDNTFLSYIRASGIAPVLEGRCDKLLELSQREHSMFMEGYDQPLCGQMLATPGCLDAVLDDDAWAHFLNLSSFIWPAVAVGTFTQSVCPAHAVGTAIDYKAHTALLEVARHYDVLDETTEALHHCGTADGHGTGPGCRFYLQDTARTVEAWTWWPDADDGHYSLLWRASMCARDSALWRHIAGTALEQSLKASLLQLQGGRLSGWPQKESQPWVDGLCQQMCADVNDGQPCVPLVKPSEPPRVLTDMRSTTATAPSEAHGPGKLDAWAGTRSAEQAGTMHEDAGFIDDDKEALARLLTTDAFLEWKIGDREGLMAVFSEYEAITSKAGAVDLFSTDMFVRWARSAPAQARAIFTKWQKLAGRHAVALFTDPWFITAARNATGSANVENRCNVLTASVIKADGPGAPMADACYRLMSTKGCVRAVLDRAAWNHFTAVQGRWGLDTALGLFTAPVCASVGKARQQRWYDAQFTLLTDASVYGEAHRMAAVRAIGTCGTKGGYRSAACQFYLIHTVQAIVHLQVQLQLDPSQREHSQRSSVLDDMKRVVRPVLWRATACALDHELWSHIADSALQHTLRTELLSTEPSGLLAAWPRDGGDGPPGTADDCRAMCAEVNGGISCPVSRAEEEATA